MDHRKREKERERERERRRKWDDEIYSIHCLFIGWVSGNLGQVAPFADEIHRQFGIDALPALLASGSVVESGAVGGGGWADHVFRMAHSRHVGHVGIGIHEDVLGGHLGVRVPAPLDVADPGLIGVLPARDGVEELALFPDVVEPEEIAVETGALGHSLAVRVSAGQ